jgi:hypothetical protein
MKSIVRIVSITLLVLSSVNLVRAQAAATAAPTAGEKPAASPAATRTDVYHVHFTKAALGKAAELADFLKKPDPSSPMPDHFLVLRHQEGDSWDYAVIHHLGTKATVEAAARQLPAGARDLNEWHNDTFANGPAWSEFARAMGIDDASKSKSAGSVYVVSVARAAPGHRDQLEKNLSEPPVAGVDTSVGNVLMQHLEGSPWQYLTIARYNSWQDFATTETNRAAQKNQPGWLEFRAHLALHTDTLTDRIAP